MTRNAPALLLADGTTYTAPARRAPAPLREWRVLLPARTDPGPKHAAPDPEPPAPAPQPPTPAEAEAAAPATAPAHRWWWYLANAALGAIVLTLMAALGGWSMWAMLNNVAGYLELHYPAQFARPATVPFWQGPAAAAVMAIDVGMVLWTVTDLWTRILGREIGWLRLGARALGCTSVALNAFTGTDPITVLVHAGPAALYIGSIEAVAYLMTKRAAKPAQAARRGRVPVLRWLFGPRRWWALRRMVIDGLSYAETVAQHHDRLRAAAGFTEAFGPEWRHHVPATVMVEYELGTLAAADPVELVALARRRARDLTRERAAYESARAAAGEPGLRRNEPENEARSESRNEPSGSTNEPRSEPPREPMNEPSGAHVIPFQAPVSSTDSPSEPLSEPRSGAVPARLTAGQGPRSEPNRKAINAVLAGRYESGEAAAKATPGASKATVNRWLGKLGWRAEGTAV